jgi:GGDEF domain-containing protein
VVSPAHVVDPSTGVWSGPKLREDGLALAQAAWDSGLPCSVVYFEVRAGKHMSNDDVRAGDDAIDGAIVAWQSLLPFDAVLARPGRDEFLAVLPGLDIAAADELHEKARTLTTSGWWPGFALWTEGMSALAVVSAAHDDHLARRGRLATAV